MRSHCRIINGEALSDLSFKRIALIVMLRIDYGDKRDLLGAIAITRGGKIRVAWTWVGSRFC